MLGLWIRLGSVKGKVRVSVVSLGVRSGKF